MTDEVNQALQGVIQRMEDGRAAEEERRGAVEELKSFLGERQKARAFEDPYGHPKITVTNHLGIYNALRPQEREEVELHEQFSFEQHQPIARAKSEQRGAFVRAGGTAEDFDAHWEAGGKDATIAQAASENLERAYQEGSVF